MLSLVSYEAFKSIKKTHPQRTTKADKKWLMIFNMMSLKRF